MNYFITAIGTDSGKTLVSAIFTEALKADYWKPVQAGIEITDVSTVAGLISNNESKMYPERWRLKHPMSPHAAAALEGVSITLNDFTLPPTQAQNLIIEGAGGVMVPLNNHAFVIDLAAKFNCQVVLVSNLYLGSINHTLLTVNELKRRNLPVNGIVFNGPENLESEQYILQYSGWPCLLKIRPEESINPGVVKHYANKLILT